MIQTTDNYFVVEEIDAKLQLVKKSGYASSLRKKE